MTKIHKLFKCHCYFDLECIKTGKKGKVSKNLFYFTGKLQVIFTVTITKHFIEGVLN
jgi:hypothetical protein